MLPACFLLFSGKLSYHVKPSSAMGQMMVGDANTLDNYNNGKLTPGVLGTNATGSLGS